MKFSGVVSFVSPLIAAHLICAGGAAARPMPQPQALTTIARGTEAPAGVPAGVPRLVQFNGSLKDAAARAVSGVASVTFAIYAEQDGGTALWSETQNVLADANGHYAVLLGAATSAGVPAELFGTGSSRWLGVTVARHEEMPRVLLASVPYALKAADAETLGGLPASAYVTEQSLAARTSTTILAPGGTTIAAAPQNSTASSEAAAATANATLPVSNTTPSGSGTADFIPLWTSATALGNSLLYQTGGKIGVGTTTPTQTLDVNGNSIFRGSFQLPPGHDAIATSGYESHSFQFQASSYNSGTAKSTTQSFGFRAEPLNNNTTNPSAVLDLFFIPNGGSDFVNTGVSWSSTGIMTFAPGQTFSGASETLTGSLNLPDTTSSNSGVITLGGSTVLNDFGGPTNLFVGHASGGGFTTDEGSYNTALGTTSLYHNTGGSNNVALGGQSLYSNTTGFGNVAVGTSALLKATSGQLNVAVGEEASTAITNATKNVAVGALAMSADTTGAQNTAVGYLSAASNATGSSLTFLGASADVGVDGLTNATAIGANSRVGENNALVLGSVNGINHATSNVHVGIGTTVPQYPLEVDDDGLGVTLYATSSVPGAQAVVGYSSATTGLSNGGDFYSSSPNGSGLVARNDTSTGYAAYLEGNVVVTGMLSKAAGSFKIDDPLDPAGKYLSHSFVESPDMMNIYNGEVITNAKGYAVVTMPVWFEALNRTFRYQLTPVGQFAQSMIASEIKDGKFTIRTSKPRVKISWQVTGIRHDAYANAHRVPTEEEKPANEQGRYMHPELFGAGPEQAISASSHAAPPAAGNPKSARAAVRSESPRTPTQSF